MKTHKHRGSLSTLSTRRETGSSRGDKSVVVGGGWGRGGGSPRTPGSPREESRLRKDTSTSTWKQLWSKADGSARDCSPLCTDSDNSIL